MTQHITHIYFDWSGTIARRHSKATLLNSKSSLREKKATLYSDTIDVLKYLTEKGYKLGIISNSSKSAEDMLKAMKTIDILKYFSASKIFANSEGKRKPHKAVFEEAMKTDNVRAASAVMVGNDYEKDIKGGKGAKMHTIFVDRERPCVHRAEADEHIHSLSQIMHIL